jgi:hypothetical protein
MTLVKHHLNKTIELLQVITTQLADFLNEHTVTQLIEHEGNDVEDMKKLLSNLRKLLVYCEEGYETSILLARQTTFPEKSAERVLYTIFHKCVIEFFSPSNDQWYENSRALYTGTHSILLRTITSAELQSLFLTLEKTFHQLRLELEYYEIDYQTKQS